MTAITLSKAKVLSNAAPGTVVGVFNQPVTAETGPLGYFSVQGSTNLVTAWTAPPPAGVYQVVVWTTTGSASFLAEIVAPPVAPVIGIKPPAVTVAHDSIAMSKLADLSVSMNDGTKFAAAATVSSDIVRLFNSKLVLSRALTSADDGVHTVTVNASQGGVMTVSLLTVTVAPSIALPPPPPPVTVTSVTFSPPTPSLKDTTPAGTSVAAANATMSDGSTFMGRWSMVDPSGLFQIDALHGTISTTRAMGARDDGDHTVTVTATTGAGLTASAVFATTPPWRDFWPQAQG